MTGHGASSGGEERLFELAERFGLDAEALMEILAILRPEGDEVHDPRGGVGLVRLEPLGQGGMAEVWRMRDERLDRVVAMKVLRPELAGHPVAHDRFLREARATARLAHPGIVPVHEVGTLADGRPFFTMDVVQGRTLDQLGDRTLRARVDAFRRAVEAVAYAHDQGVLHRDLKPSNIMVGQFGSVFVLDWGLMSWTEGAGVSGPGLTRIDAVPGTPGYLSPEQLAGEPLGPPSDVFSLGLVLYELLEGRPAFSVDDPERAVAELASGQVPAPRAGPEELRRVVERATAWRPSDRLPHAGALAGVLSAWLDGEARREQADACLEEARRLGAEERALRARGAEVGRRAEAALAGVESHAPLVDKLVGWALQDERDALRAEAELVSLRRMQALHGALSFDGDHEGALGALADHWHGVHALAEGSRNLRLAREAESQLRFYDRGRYGAYLQGLGRLTVRTDPPGVHAVLFRLQERERRMVAVEPRPIGPTPAVVEGLPRGSYVVRFEGQGVVLPVWVRRNDDVAPPVLRLPRPEELGPDDVLVPGGPFWTGVPDGRFESLPWQEDHLDAFVVRRHPVTHGEYLAFLDDLVRQGREADALRWAPRERGTPDNPGPYCYGRTARGGFTLVPDADGDMWDPRWPVFLVDHGSAVAYAAWWSARTGLPWRLPTEREWEKAARGVDGRAYPWGDRFDPRFACVRGSHAGRPLPAPVDAFPDDVSVYGVRGMAGNMRDWCSDPFQMVSGPAVVSGSQKALKGGCWYFPESGAHAAARYALDATNRGDTVSFRLVRTFG